MLNNSLPDRIVLRTISDDINPYYLSYKRQKEGGFKLEKYSNELPRIEKIAIWVSRFLSPNSKFPEDEIKKLIESGRFKMLSEDEIIFLEAVLGYKFFD